MHILDLPDHLLEHMGHAALASCPRDLLRTCQASQSFHSKLREVQRLAERSRATWVQELSAKQINISSDGRTLTVAGHDDSVEPWVSGRLLPTTGTSAWKVRIGKHEEKENDGNGMWIGVCDADACYSWGVSLHSGRLRFISRDEDGALDYGGPPTGYPSGNYTTIVLKDDLGQRTGLHGRADGTVIEVILDHDTGALGYRIDDGPYLKAFPLEPNEKTGKKQKPKAFPRGAALRPYASCYYVGDHISFVAPTISTTPA